MQNINQGAKTMVMECDCGKSHTGDQRTAKFWYKIHGKVCIQARRTLPIYGLKILATDEARINNSLIGANLAKTLQIIETHSK